MVSFWIVLALMGAVFQLGRNAFQKTLKAYFNDWIVTWTRFFFGLPLVALVYVVVCQAPQLGHGALFFCYCLIGGIAQIGGTRCLMGCFSHRQFAVGITFMKLESIVTALIGLAVFGDALTGFGFLMVFFGGLGVVLVACGQQKVTLVNIKRALVAPAALYGAGSGVLFAVASVLFRQANLLVANPDPLARGVVTLLVVIGMQAVLMTIGLLVKFPKDCFRIRHYLPRVAIIGLLGVSASMCWFVAFGLANAAYVKTVGQMDAVLSILVGWWWFKERLTRLEVLGVFLVVVSVGFAMVML